MGRTISVDLGLFGKHVEIEGNEKTVYWPSSRELCNSIEYDIENKTMYDAVLSFINLSNPVLIKLLIELAEKQLKSGQDKAVDNDFLLYLNIYDKYTKHVYFDMYFDVNYKDGKLVAQPRMHHLGE